MNNLAYLIRENRLNDAKTQVEYAKEIGITNVTLSHIENRKHIGLNVLKKLSIFTKISPKELRKLMFEEIDND